MRAELDTTEYPSGIKIPDRDMASLADTGILTRHDFHGEWNYTLHPHPDTPAPDQLISSRTLSSGSDA